MRDIQTARKIFDYMRNCPKLAELWSIGGDENFDNSVILPNGSSNRYSYTDTQDINGNYECEITPAPSVFEDYQINCYKYFDPKDSTAPVANINVMNYEDVTEVCEWVEEQDKALNFPDIGEQVVSIECNPFVPQIRFVDDELGIIAYFVTIRIRYVNRAKGRSVFYEHSD